MHTVLLSRSSLSSVFLRISVGPAVGHRRLPSAREQPAPSTLTVTDASGSVVPGAKVTALNTGTGAQLRVR